MPLPKALLCSLGDYTTDTEEAKLRQTGFATATVRWPDLLNQTNDWMQLAEVLDEPAVQAWVFAGSPADVTEDLLCRISLLTLALHRESPPNTAFVLCEEGNTPSLSPFLSHISIHHSLAPFAARLMAARFRPGVQLSLPFHIRAVLNPMIGLWLELAPDGNESQPDFVSGVLNAEITAFGVGPRCAIPAKSTLTFPMLGIEGTCRDAPFSACAAQNALDERTACFCKVSGIPAGVFLGRYPQEDKSSPCGEDWQAVPLLFLDL